MEPHEIMDATMATGEADKLKKLTGKSVELFNSYRRQPKCKEQPTATGNFSPLHHYMQFFHLRHAVNPTGAAQMHSLLTKEIEVEKAEDGPQLNKLIGVLKAALETIDHMSVEDIEGASKEDLILLNGLIEESCERLPGVQGRVVGEKNRRSCLRKVC
jgi:hypothetical protein